MALVTVQGHSAGDRHSVDWHDATRCTPASNGTAPVPGFSQDQALRNSSSIVSRRPMSLEYSAIAMCHLAERKTSLNSEGIVGAQFAVLISNCAPDRLRRLSVDADERPSHVFRVTEAYRLRYAFDRFGGRLYAASG